MDDLEVISRVSRGQRSFLLEAESRRSLGLLEVSPIFKESVTRGWRRILPRLCRERGELYEFRNDVINIQVMDFVPLAGHQGTDDTQFDFGDCFLESTMSTNKIASLLGFTRTMWISEPDLETVFAKYRRFARREYQNSADPIAMWRAEYHKGE